MTKNKGSQGFTIIEALIVVGILAVFTFMTLNYTSLSTQGTNLSRYIGTQNRVISTIRETVILPATLRASMMAYSNGNPVNPGLLGCAGCNPAYPCNSGGTPQPLTLFSPLIGFDSSGNIVGVQPISGPATAPLRIDSFGNTCTTPSPECSLLLSTSMVAQCGPPTKPAVALNPVNLELLPTSTCICAEVIQVFFTIQLDPIYTSSNPALSSFINAVTNNVSVPVVAISGNTPN